ncbi:serine hydrolase domain-containing protein [Allostreptomyces psammosilenae]|uniref:CubicO group peptidase (Beta-lactamase class C family) n=1 Tax=Allostreptomyces psammosilenae TaxID=1892865 RepID=A0A853A056_9ACTN|nr:serine hydrolase domain-containing protein [Allostreptomyces psammosilenae]NYI03768.1 CubicO group peptidase (beta-lactamase class C family) [Allostreptomyces psammosilenae]
MTTARRSVLGLLGTASLAAGASLAASGPASAATPAGTAADTRSGAPGSGQVPAGLRPGGELDRLVADLAARDAFSGSVLVAHRGRPVLARAHGLANRELSIPNGTDTLFILGSVTKLFTAVAVAQLAQRGELAFQGKLGDYLDGFPAEIAGTVTVHQLLTHTSGMGDYHRNPAFWELKDGWDSEQEVMDGIAAIIRGEPLGFVPGTGYAYSNSAFHVLGQIVARVSGRPYHDYVREHVFRAAGMTSADFYTMPQWRADRRIARPYATGEDGERYDAIAEHGFVGTPAGGSFAHCADLARFAHALTHGELLDPAHTALLLGGRVPMPMRTAPGTQSVFEGYGQLVVHVGGRVVLSRNGGSPGVSTDMEVLPAGDLTVVALSNYDMRTVEPVASLARRLLAGG